MNEKELLSRLQKLKEDVKNNLKQQGVVLPVKTAKGIRLDNYEIRLEKSRYRIFNKWNEIEVDNINYLQTAVIIANNLALKKQTLDVILSEDMRAGAAEFDLKVFENRFQKSLKNHDVFGIQHYGVRMTETRRKYKHHYNAIENVYQRLLKSLKVSGKTNK